MTKKRRLGKRQSEQAKDFLNALSGDTEPITEELIKELVGKGWPEKELREAAKNGFRYSRTKDSLWSPINSF